MATNANWTVIFDDQLIIKKAGDAAGSGYIIDDSSFWNQSKFSNIWAIQHGTSNVSDEVEYRDETPHSSYADADLGDVSQFTTRWDAAHLNQLQIDWDADNEEGETSEEKIARLGPRPTSYSS
jgi:hypothetical protein